MKICYVPPVAAAVSNLPATTGTVIELNWFQALGQSISTSVSNAIDGSMQSVQNAVYGALDQFKTDVCLYLNEQWIKFIDASFIICLSIAFAGAICGVLGIKKGYQVTILSVVFYCLLRLFSFLMGWY